MTNLDLCYTPATELQRLYRNGELSPLEVVRNSLERIAEVNPQLNCFCFTYPEEALAAARAAEQRFANGKPRPLEGIPIAIKDFTPTRGKVTTRGSRLLENWVPDWSAVIVERLEAAGAIIVGKTTTPEFATSGFTDSPLWGITRNPWNTARIPMDIIDTCFDNISHFGPIARNVTDVALFLDITQGEHPSDIQSLPTCELSIPVPADVRGLKFALDVTLGFCAVEAGVEANLRSTADALRDAGAEVEEIDLGWDRNIVDMWNGTWGIFMAAAYRRLTDVPLAENRARMSKGLVDLIEAGLEVDAVTAREWEFERSRYWRKLGAVLETHHALLCPTMAITAPPVEKRDWDFGATNAEGLMECMDMTGAFNYTAQCPALSVPSGFADGLPTATQIVARRYDDALALRIGAAIENAMPWAQLRPPV